MKYAIEHARYKDNTLTDLVDSINHYDYFDSLEEVKLALDKLNESWIDELVCYLVIDLKTDLIIDEINIRS